MQVLPRPHHEHSNTLPDYGLGCRGLGGAIVDQQDFSNGDRRFTFDATFKLETTA